jgi:hypothetical protein
MFLQEKRLSLLKWMEDKVRLGVLFVQKACWKTLLNEQKQDTEAKRPSGTCVDARSRPLESRIVLQALGPSL